MIDIDDTLLLWDDIQKKTKDKVEMIYAGKKIYLTPHTGHIDLIKHWHEQGYCLYAWSNNGPKWAKNAIKKLKLKKYIYHVMNKSSKFLDDLEADKVLGSRVFLPVKK